MLQGLYLEVSYRLIESEETMGACKHGGTCTLVRRSPEHSKSMTSLAGVNDILVSRKGERKRL